MKKVLKVAAFENGQFPIDLNKIKAWYRPGRNTRARFGLEETFCPLYRAYYVEDILDQEVKVFHVNGKNGAFIPFYALVPYEVYERIGALTPEMNADFNQIEVEQGERFLMFIYQKEEGNWKYDGQYFY